MAGGLPSLKKLDASTTAPQFSMLQLAMHYVNGASHQLQ